MSSLSLKPLWQGRVDAQEGEDALRWHQVVLPYAQTLPKGIVLLGFACDEGVQRNHGRAGARNGPKALRQALANLPVHGQMPLYDAGDVTLPRNASNDLEMGQVAFAEKVAGIVKAGHFPLAMGGGHEIAFANFCGLDNALTSIYGGDQNIGIVNLDAHFDIRLNTQATSGTPFQQIYQWQAEKGSNFHYCCLGVGKYANTAALFRRAEEIGVVWRTDEEMAGNALGDTLVALDVFMANVDHVYFTICLDVLPACLTPGVSAPSARGIDLEAVEQVMDHVVNSGKLRLADIAEFNPNYDIDARTARLAARLMARLADGVESMVSTWR